MAEPVVTAPSAGLGVHLAAQAERAPALLVVFLRGGADGLSLVAPAFEDAYHRARPRLAIPASRLGKLDGRFGLHPRLEPLRGLFEDGTLGVVHAVGSEDQTRSHFEAQDFMEHGGLEAGGWLGRFQRFRAREGESPVSAVSFGATAAESLRGAPSVTVIESLRDFGLPPEMQPLLQHLGSLYGRDSTILAARGEQTLRALKSLAALAEAEVRPQHGAAYGEDGFSRSLAQAAALLRSGLGVEAITVDLHGWDSHITQETLIEPRMEELARGLAAFRRDLGRELDRVSVVVMTEFGRRLRENSAFGTDHGRGGVFFLMGGGTPAAGQVVADWPGLEDEQLEEPGDLRVTTDYRDVLWPVLQRTATAPLTQVFPGFAPRGLAV